MENRIAIGSLASLLAQATGKSRKLCDDFLREFFRVIAETLQEGEPVKIKGFGSFKVLEVESRTSVNVNTGESYEIAPYKKVVFSPAKELASAINAPFEEFKSVEIDDEMPEDLIIEEDEIEEPETENEEIETDEENIIEKEIKDDELKEEGLKETVIIEEGIVEEEIKEEELSDENFVGKERLQQGSDEEGEDDNITYEAYKEIEETSSLSLKEPEEKSESLENLVSDTSEEEIVPESTTENSNFIASSSDSGPIERDTVPVTPPIVEKRERRRREGNVYVPPVAPPKYEEPRKSRFGIGFLVGSLVTLVVCVIIFMLGCFFDWWPVNFGNPKEEVAVQATQDDESSLAEETDSIIETEKISEIEEEPTYDTVSTTRYLTTIARDHYGNFNFWPYIYLENEAILGHPDRITPGTKVKVPDLSKYGVNPANKEDVQKAKQKALEIYSRFK